MTSCGNKNDGNIKGTDILDEITLRRKNLIVSLNKTGVVGVLFFAPVSFLFTCIWLKRCDLLDLTWGGFGLHVLLMATAFLLVAPMASITYRLLVDALGVTRKTAMKVHGYLLLVSNAVGITGVRTVWVAHSSTYHFKSSHSILGIFALSIFTAQLLTASYVFFIGSKALRAAYRQLHMAVGQGLIVVMLFIPALGMMFFESEAYNESWDDVGVAGYYRPYMTVAQYGIAFLMFSVILVFYAEILV